MKRLKDLWELLKFHFGGRERYHAKMAELEATKQALLLERQMMLAQVLQEIPSMRPHPRRKPELRN